MQKVSCKKYLEQKLYSIKLELKELEIQHRIHIAEFNTKKDLLDREITAIELQLENAKEE
jgi:hypothetical protein